MIVKVKLESLRMMMDKMGGQGWSEAGRRWSTKLLPKDGESQADWIDRMINRMKTGAREKKLASHIHFLWNICHMAPNASDLASQEAYLSRHGVQIQKSVSIIEKRVERFAGHILHLEEPDLLGADKAATFLEKNACCAYGTILPLLLLLLKEACLRRRSD